MDQTGRFAASSWLVNRLLDIALSLGLIHDRYGRQADDHEKAQGKIGDCTK